MEPLDLAEIKGSENSRGWSGPSARESAFPMRCLSEFFARQPEADERPLSGRCCLPPGWRQSITSLERDQSVSSSRAFAEDPYFAALSSKKAIAAGP